MTTPLTNSSPVNPAFGPAPLHPTFKLEPMLPEQIEGYKRMTVAEKFRQLQAMYRMGVAMKKAQLRREHPDWSDEELERAARWAVIHAPD